MLCGQTCLGWAENLREHARARGWNWVGWLMMGPMGVSTGLGFAVGHVGLGRAPLRTRTSTWAELGGVVDDGVSRCQHGLEFHSRGDTVSLRFWEGGNHEQDVCIAIKVRKRLSSLQNGLAPVRRRIKIPVNCAVAQRQSEATSIMACRSQGDPLCLR